MYELSSPFETIFYEEAIRFRETLDSLESCDTADEAQAKVTDALRKLNRTCGYLGLSLKVESQTHLVDWSAGEVSGANLEILDATLDGVLIGFAMMPYENPVSGEAELALHTIMDTSIYASDIEHDCRVIVVTPIAGASISLLTD